jgi:hypothetical protein
MTLLKYKHAILPAALILVAFIQSFPHRLILGPVASDVCISIARLLIFLIVFKRRVSRLVTFVATCVAIILDWAHYVLPASYHPVLITVVYHAASLLLLGFATVVILRNIFEQHVVRHDDVLGAVCGYLLAGAAFSNIFSLIESFVPGSFSVGPGFAARLDSWHGSIAVLNYVSLGSLTSSGSGAVLPVRPPATILTALEAMFGQFYIAVVVAQLVGARLSRAIERNTSSERVRETQSR